MPTKTKTNKEPVDEGAQAQSRVQGPSNDNDNDKDNEKDNDKDNDSDITMA